MDAAIREWVTGFTCGPCLMEANSERRAGVLVIVQDPGQDLDVLALCYRHAGVYVGRWAEPVAPASIGGAARELGHAARVLWWVLVSAVFRRGG